MATVTNPCDESTADLYKPCARARSEASFSEFHYDNSVHPPAGVGSARLWHHKAKNCSDRDHRSQVEEVLRMTPQQEYNSQSERLEGPRLDPSKARGYAGNMSVHTKAKVTLLGNHEAPAQGKQPKMEGGTQKPEKVKRVRGFIMDISRKAPAACAPPPRSTDPLRPDEEKFDRQMKRHGYKLAESRWTWNECHEVTGQDPDFVAMHRPEVVLEGLSAVQSKTWTSVKGEKKYNIFGAQDMIPAATKPFLPADCPPSARHIYQNDKQHFQGFERGCRPKGLPREGSAVEYLGESPEMWNCMSGQERPLDKWRSMSARGGQRNWMNDAQSYYAGDDARSPAGYYPATLNSPQQPQSARGLRSPQSARSLRSPTGSSQFDQYQGDTTRRESPRRTDQRRSLLSSPSEAGSRVSMRSRASVTSSQRELCAPRWR